MTYWQKKFLKHQIWPLIQIKIWLPKLVGSCSNLKSLSTSSYLRHDINKTFKNVCSGEITVIVNININNHLEREQLILRLLDEKKFLMVRSKNYTWASLQILAIASITSHFCSNDEVAASRMLRQISLKNISTWDLRCRLYLAKSSMKRAIDNSNTSLMFETPFWESATHKYDLMADTNISSLQNASPPFCRMPIITDSCLKLSNLRWILDIFWFT